MVATRIGSGTRPLEYGPKRISPVRGWVSRSESRSGWKASLGSLRQTWGGNFAAHTPALLEKAVSPESRNTASIPSPIPKARSSAPSAAMRFAQKAMSALSWRLYRLTDRSREKSAATPRFSSLMPSNTVRGSINTQRRSSAQSRRIPMPSRHRNSEWPPTVPASVPACCFSSSQISQLGSLGARRSVLPRRIAIKPNCRAMARVRAESNKPRSPESYRRRFVSMVCRSKSVIS